MKSHPDSDDAHHLFPAGNTFRQNLRRLAISHNFILSSKLPYYLSPVFIIVYNARQGQSNIFAFVAVEEMLHSYSTLQATAEQQTSHIDVLAFSIHAENTLSVQGVL
jgi:hypothetical protein